MTAKDLYDLVRLYMDEADDSFVSPPQVQQMLKMAYDQFRGMITQIDPSILSARVSIQMPANTTSYDLATGTPSILGKNPSAAKMQRLLSVQGLDPNGLPYMLFAGSGSFDELRGASFNSRYYLEGSLLSFSSWIPQPIRLTYVPVASVDWSKIGPSDNEFVDDLEEFHDLIALLAWKHYNLRDWQGGAKVTPLDQQIQVRTSAFKAFLMYGRDRGASDHVIMSNNSGY